MVGDDIRTDVLAAQRVGLRGAFVLSGKHGLEDIETGGGRAGRRPDVIAPTLRDVVSALAERRAAGASLRPRRYTGHLPRPPEGRGPTADAQRITETTMSTEARPRLKITYATLRNDNEELHAQYEAGLAKARTMLGGSYRNFVGGAERDGDGTFEKRSPIDGSVIGHVRKGTREDVQDAIAAAREASRPGAAGRGRSASRSCAGSPT